MASGQEPQGGVGRTSSRHPLRQSLVGGSQQDSASRPPCLGSSHRSSGPGKEPGQRTSTGPREKATGLPWGPLWSKGDIRASFAARLLLSDQPFPKGSLAPLPTRTPPQPPCVCHPDLQAGRRPVKLMPLAFISCRAACGLLPHCVFRGKWGSDSHRILTAFLLPRYPAWLIRKARRTAALHAMP